MKWPRTNLGLGLMLEGPNPVDAVDPADAVVVGLGPILETPMDLIQTMVDD